MESQSAKQWGRVWQACERLLKSVCKGRSQKVKERVVLDTLEICRSPGSEFNIDDFVDVPCFGRNVDGGLTRDASVQVRDEKASAFDTRREVLGKKVSVRTLQADVVRIGHRAVGHARLRQLFCEVQEIQIQITKPQNLGGHSRFETDSVRLELQV